MMNYEFKEQDAYDFASHVGISVRRAGNNLHFKMCPYCKNKKDKETFAINLKNGQFACLRASCGVTGNMITLSKDFDFSLGNDFDEYYAPKKKFRTFATPKEKIIPKESALKYLASRGISEETARKYEITVKTKQDNVLVFPFFDEKGILQFIKYRDTEFFVGKTYVNKKGETVKSPKEWREADTKPILFGMKQCNDKFDRLVISEGQLDSLSIAESGIENATSVPSGSKCFTFIPYCWDWITKFKEIVVFGDFEKGHMTLLDDFKQRFRNQVIKAVREEDYKGCKDANEILWKFGKDAVKFAVENAEILPIKHILKVSDLHVYDDTEDEKLPTGIAYLDELLNGGLPFGQVHIISGKSGEGKSTFASQILCSALDNGYTCLAYSGELKNEKFVKALDRQLAGPFNLIKVERSNGSIDYVPKREVLNKIIPWYEDRLYLYDSNSDGISSTTESEDLLKIIDMAIARYNCRFVIIDNLMTALMMSICKSSNTNDRQSEIIERMRLIAKSRNIIILLVAHKRKSSTWSSTNDNDEVAGSSNVTNAAGVILNYSRGKFIENPKENEISYEDDERELKLSKSRDEGILDLKGTKVFYDSISKRIFSEQNEAVKKYQWENPEPKIDFYKYAQDDEPTPFDE